MIKFFVTDVRLLRLGEREMVVVEVLGMDMGVIMGVPVAAAIRLSCWSKRRRRIQLCIWRQEVGKRT